MEYLGYNGILCRFDVKLRFYLDVKKLFIWPAMKNVLFSLLKNIKNMIYGLVKK